MVGRVPVGHEFLEEAFSDITVISKKIAHFENVLNFTTRRFIFPIRKVNLLVVFYDAK